MMRVRKERWHVTRGTASAKVKGGGRLCSWTTAPFGTNVGVDLATGVLVFRGVPRCCLLGGGVTLRGELCISFCFLSVSRCFLLAAFTCGLCARFEIAREKAKKTYEWVKTQRTIKRACMVVLHCAFVV
jgi:hypothetical protein